MKLWRKKKGFDYFLEENILEGYKKQSIEMRLKWLFQLNELRKHYPREIIESHEKFRKGEI